ncbi:MAG TPA: hypothetical protein VGM19_02380 [Armatimonadota bacterium]|jgi:hypothetical protein
MNASMRLGWRLCTLLIPALLTVGAAWAQAPAAAPSLVTNAGFETWEPNKPSGVQPALPDGVPAGWTAGLSSYEQGKTPGFVMQGEIARDLAIKHSGEASARIHNGLDTDITDLDLPGIAVSPNTSYRLSVWIRGDSIVLNPNDGAGVIVWSVYGPRQPSPGREQQYTVQTAPQRDGTFDWRRFTIRVDTPPDGEVMRLAFQLRRASGTVWYDDAELTAVGKIRVVETY